MRLHRFYTTQKLTESLIYTDTNHIHQWKNVFRYGEGQALTLFGDGFEHTYKIISIDKKQASLVEVSREPSRLRTKNIKLALGLIKKDNFELSLEKCTEIGVSEFIPIITDRSLQKMYGLERLQKILVEATEQSGWGSVPILRAAVTLDELLESDECIVLNMHGNSAVPQNLKNKTICIGPEGGWSVLELENIKNKDVDTVSLPTGVLRAETAAIVASGLTSM